MATRGTAPRLLALAVLTAGGLTRMTRLARRSGVTDAEIANPLPGDELLPDANAVIDRAATLNATAADVWPWLVQLGKGRAGWYFPSWVERVAVPPGHRSLRRVDPMLQALRAGDDVPDWGPGEAVLRVMTVDPERAIVYLSLRDKSDHHRWPADDFDRSTVFGFSWALVLTDLDGDRTRLHFRLRLRLAESRLPTAELGGIIDWATVALLFRGLAERVAA